MGHDSRVVSHLIAISFASALGACSNEAALEARYEQGYEAGFAEAEAAGNKRIAELEDAIAESIDHLEEAENEIESVESEADAAATGGRYSTTLSPLDIRDMQRSANAAKDHAETAGELVSAAKDALDGAQ